MTIFLEKPTTKKQIPLPLPSDALRIFVSPKDESFASMFSSTFEVLIFQDLIENLMSNVAFPS